MLSTRRSLANATMISRVALAIGIAGPLATMTALGWYALPNGDDYCRGRLLPLVRAVPGWHTSPNALAYVITSWRLWTGRWLAMAIEPTVLTRVDITSGYAALIFGVWAALLALIVVVVRGVLSGACTRRVVAVGALLLWAVFWSGMPGPGDGLFWFTGAVENLLGVGLAAAVVVLLAYAAGSEGRRRRVSLMCASTASPSSRPWEQE
jgi:hypothetical protein